MASHSHADSTPAIVGAQDERPERAVRVVVYSSNEATRARIITALGTRPAPGLVVTYVETARGDELIARLDAGGLDLAILDGEAAPTGGMGLARQLKDELDGPPPVLLIVGRRDDAWLATWSRAESVISHPIDAVQIASAVSALLVGDADPVAAH
jgi:DNA-binding NarL/FixJ family response regulator